MCESEWKTRKGLEEVRKAVEEGGRGRKAWGSNGMLQLHPLLLLQIVTAQCHVSCPWPLRLVQALGNRLKDSMDGPSRVIDPHLHNTMMTHCEPTPSNPPMVVHTQQLHHSLAYPCCKYKSLSRYGGNDSYCQQYKPVVSIKAKVVRYK